MANSPYNNDYDICRELWKNSYLKRIHTQKLRMFLNISGSHTTFDCKVQFDEVQVIKDGISTILEELVKDKPCIYPYFKNGICFTYYLSYFMI